MYQPEDCVLLFSKVETLSWPSAGNAGILNVTLLRGQ